VLNTLFYKYSGQTDIIVGTGIAGRPHADLQRIIGMFVNTLAMRNYPKGEKTYEEFLKEVIAHSITAFENQDVQFEELVEKLAVERNPSRNPLFDISMVVQNFRQVNTGKGISTGGISTGEKFGQNETLPRTDNNYPSSGLEYKNPTAKFDMTFFIRESEGDISINVEYYTGIFKQETIRRLTSHFQNIVKAVIDEPDIKLKDIEIISKEEKEQVLNEFNDTVEEFPRDKTIHRLVEEQVEKTPDYIAVVHGLAVLSYQELGQKANRLARYLFYEHGVQPDDRVGILMAGSIHLAVALMGILKAGAAYVPLDPSLPVERIKYMIRDASIGVVISERKYIKTLNGLQWECSGLHRYLCTDSFDIYAEDEVEQSELMNRELWDHVGETGIGEITGGGWVSSYTGESLSREEMDEYGNNIVKKLAPLLHPGVRVLEIGCASGITMYRIAANVGLYYGTDLSPVIIEKNKKRVKQEGHRNIKLSCLAAHEIDQLEERNFDLIIMNSVIQCFHGHNYLGKVIHMCIDLLGERGYLFIGDIMDQEKKGALVRELEEFKRDTGATKNYTTKTDFSSELFVSRGYWRDLAAGLKEVEAVEFSGKIHTIENELSKFRYDTLMSVNKKVSSAENKVQGEKEKYQDDLRVLSGFGCGPFHLDIPCGSLAYIIYTSGTGGEPKGVEVEHRGVVNTLLSRGAEYEMGPDVVSLQLFSYGFDGFVTSFFTPIISGARVVLLKKEEMGDIEKIRDVIRGNQVTHFISVPSFYSVLIESAVGEDLSSLRAVTLAGERVNGNVLERTVAKNDTLEIINEYGVTEGSVMSTIYRRQERDAIIKIGGPIWNTRLYILDEAQRLLPIGVAGELCLSGDGLARGYLNNPELTAEKFDHDLWDFQDYRDEEKRGNYQKFLQKEPPGRRRLYKTGDLARWLWDGNVEFLGRIDYQVKIRGFRIELGEIESRLSRHESIREAVVIDRENREGDRYLCAYINFGSVSGLTHAEMKEYLSRVVPDYMVPAYFVQLDEIPLTSSGKVDRKKLPEPETAASEGYTPPGNRVEEALVKIWSEVLGVDVLPGIEANFFDLGGHSLKATILTSRIHKELDVKVPLAEVFKRQTIRELAGYIRETGQTKYAVVEPLEKKEYYALSSAQKRLYFLQQMAPGSTGYNMPLVLSMGKELEREKLESTLKKLIARHESLRTSFGTVNDIPVQEIHDRVEFEMEYYDLAGHFIRPFDLSCAPLMRSGLIRHPDGNHTWMVDMHHIVSDGTSHTILTEDFTALYNGEELEPLPLQYKDFSGWQNHLFASGAIKVQEDYWLEIPRLQLPGDYKRPEVFTFAGANFNFMPDREDGVRFGALAARNGGTLYMNILALLNTLFYKYTGQTDIIVGTGIAGRPHADLQRIIGMFVNTLAMRSYPKGEKTYEEFLKEVIAHSIAAFENQDVQFEELVDKLDLERDASRNPVFDMMMVVQNFGKAGKGVSPSGEERAVEYENPTAKFDMTFYVHEIGEDIFINIEYYTAVFKRDTIACLVRHFKNVIKEVVSNPAVKLEDIDMVSAEEKKQVLYEFNDTATDYPGDKTIHRLFEEQAAKTPDHIAVVGAVHLRKPFNRMTG
jgi:fengycin family lipopeptide synthetase D